MSGILINRANALRGAVAGAIGSVLLLAAVPAQAQEDNAPDIQFIRKVLGAVGLRDNTPNIEYRERSPLVIPPNTAALPPPVPADVNNPNWPVDPEVREAHARAVQATKPGATGDMIYDDGRVLTPAELAKGRARGRGVTATPNEIDRQSSPRELGAPTLWNFVGKAFGRVEDEEAKFTGEPARTSLIEPPAGYQTPASTYKYGLGKKNEKPKATNYLATQGVLPEEKK
jgi:hypothetical protein